MTTDTYRSVADLNAESANHTRRINRAIKLYGADLCKELYLYYRRSGNGASTIGFEYGLTTRAADAAINAGRFLLNY